MGPAIDVCVSYVKGSCQGLKLRALRDPLLPLRRKRATRLHDDGDPRSPSVHCTGQVYKAAFRCVVSISVRTASVVSHWNALPRCTISSQRLVACRHLMDLVHRWCPLQYLFMAQLSRPWVMIVYLLLFEPPMTSRLGEDSGLHNAAEDR